MIITLSLRVRLIFSLILSLCCHLSSFSVIAVGLNQFSDLTSEEMGRRYVGLDVSEAERRADIQRKLTLAGFVRYVFSATLRTMVCILLFRDLTVSPLLIRPFAFVPGSILLCHACIACIALFLHQACGLRSYMPSHSFLLPPLFANSEQKQSVHLMADQSIDWVTKGMVTPVKNQGDCGRQVT